MHSPPNNPSPHKPALVGSFHRQQTWGVEAKDRSLPIQGSSEEVRLPWEATSGTGGIEQKS